MSTGKVKKIHRAALLGIRRGTYNCSAYYQQRRGWCFYQCCREEDLLRPRFPATQQPEPEQLFPVSTPAALFTSDSPGNTSSPGNSQPSLGPEPEQFIGLLPRFAAGPGSCESCWYFNPNNLSAYSQPRRLPVAADSRSAAGGYPEQFVGLSPGTSAALIPNPEYS